MIKRLPALLFIVILVALPASASITLTVNAGLLTTETGSALPDGNLILLIASPTGVFGATTGNQFVTGDNLILGSSVGSSVVGTGALAMTNDGTAGETLNTITNINLGIGSTGLIASAQSSIVTGDKVAIRFYDNYTLADFENGVPVTGDYGTYTTLLTAAPDGGLDWTLPAAGANDTFSAGLNFFTLSDAGTQLNIEGQALTPTLDGSVAVPEPSTYALLATGLLFVAGMAVRKKRLAVVT
jgi:hypothetical protein